MDAAAASVLNATEFLAERAGRRLSRNCDEARAAGFTTACNLTPRRAVADDSSTVLVYPYSKSKERDNPLSSFGAASRQQG